MNSRCYQQNASNYQYYGARGISVCQQWRESFETFRADMGECPNKNMTLERMDNELGYSPENCIWATKAEQNKHRSYCIQLTHNGITMNATDWAKKLGMPAGSLIQRLRLGWSAERALTRPLKKRAAK